MRINKYIAHATNLSRREADNAVSAGRVTVNGKTASMGAQIDENSVVVFDGKPLSGKTAYTYLMLNKPVGYLCSRRSQGGVPTVYELLPEQYRPLKAVGRLDKDSSGLILLTDDGDFAFRMTHPSFHKVKVYEVELSKPLEPLHQQMISDYGITLEDGQSQLIIERLTSSKVLETTAQSPEPRTQNLHGYQVTMYEGRNRQIRRTFSALGYTVTKLHRTQFGPHSLTDLPPGELHVLDSNQ